MDKGWKIQIVTFLLVMAFVVGFRTWNNSIKKAQIVEQERFVEEEENFEKIEGRLIIRSEVYGEGEGMKMYLASCEVSDCDNTVVENVYVWRNERWR